ncbi:ATP-binding protein [Desulfopila sp. IMCC35006]|uniref:hybrid sensor histidine kinase/response regulator n=1 Tax=Desulfopila sp. IMCC35006 TaxID=2569542 RepID=UPI00142E9863|nr:ATP-binding protein [Desulfopila sp. IMCC35006]
MPDNDFSNSIPSGTAGAILPVGRIRKSFFVFLPGSIYDTDSLDTFLNDLAWLRNIAIVVLAVSLLVIVIATGIILRVLIRKPLTIFSQEMEKVARGDRGYRFYDVRHKELIGIAQRFSKMADEVWERQQSLKEEVVERKRAVDRMRESEARTHGILDAIPDMLFQFDNVGRFLELRGGAEDFTITSEQCVGKTIEQVMPADVAGNFRKQLIGTFASRGVRVFEYHLPVRDEVRHFECRLVAVSDDLALAMVRNITERVTAAEEKKRLLEQLQRAQKMEAIGILAGGVAHDLNNVLSGLVSYPELILMKLPENSPLEKSIRTIQSSGERAANIVQDLLTLARRGVAVSETVNLNEVINDYLKNPEYEILRRTHPGIKMELNLSPDLLSLSGSPVHLAKTVMNLIVNATEVISTEGVIRIKTENRYIDTPIKGYDDVEEGDYVMLRIMDNGIGIPDEDVSRIFEPFYTKKMMGRSGTGLGMAVVWGTVKDHHGYIDIQSVEGQGTAVTIYLSSTKAPRIQVNELEKIEEMRGAGQRILVIDDVKEQREIATAILSQIGYQVESVSSGETAVDYLLNHQIDLLVLDMIMDPGIDGLETYRRIICNHPGQRAIITSGFSESERVNEAKRLGAAVYVKKPYRVEALAKATRDALQ